MIFRSIFLFFLLPYLAHAQTKLTYTYTINIVNEYEGIRSDITFDTLSGEIIFDTSSDSFTTSIQLEPTNKSQLKDTKLIGSFLLAAIRSNIAFNNDQKLRSLIRNLALNEVDGYYYFSDINPGIYDVEASYVGYTKNRKVAVVIKKDQSNTLNISIEQGQFDQVLGCGGYWYGRPLIEFDNTSTGAKFTSEDIRTMPIPR